MRKSAVAVGLAVVVFGCGGDWFHEVQPEGIQLLVEVLQVPAWADWEETIKVKNTIYNWGKSPVPIPFRVYFYLSDDDKYDDGTDVELAWRQLVGLDGSARDTEETDITLPGSGTPAAYYIIAYVDKDGWVDEIVGGEEDNITVAGPMSIFDPPVGIDLIVKDVSTPTNGEWGKNWYIDYVVRNRGTVNCTPPGFDVDFYLSTDRDFDPFSDFALDTSPWDATVAISSLNGQSEDSGTVNFLLPPEGFLPNGNYYVVAVVDPPIASGGAVTETGDPQAELNNVTISKNSAYLAEFPNLLISSMTVQTTLYWGDTYTVTVRVRNDTITDIPISQSIAVRVLLSTDNVIQISDTLLGQASINGLAALTSTYVSVNIGIPAGGADDTRWVGAYVDPLDVVMEKSDTDNTYSVIRTIRDPADGYEPNNTDTTAEDLSFYYPHYMESYFANIYPSGDADWYKFYVWQENDWIYVYLYPPTTDDYDVYLWRGDFTGDQTVGLVGQSTLTGKGVQEYIHLYSTQVTIGWYFVQVVPKGADWDATNYTLVLDVW